MRSLLKVLYMKDYNVQRDSGRLPVFDVNKYPELKQQIEPGIWDGQHSG